MAKSARTPRRILIAYNDSPSAVRALRFAEALAGLSGAQLHILAVADALHLGAEVEDRAYIEYSRRKGHQMLRSARLKAHSRVRVRLVIGAPPQQIVRYAYAYDIDHIVLGSGAHSLFGRSWLSPVVRRVIATAPCAVTTVPLISEQPGFGKTRAPTADEDDLAKDVSYSIGFH
jgi:nucleotide-binding universal stress UspA family protein